jgi:cephalosporin hydroxylase
MKFIRQVFRIFYWSISNFKSAIFGLRNAMYSKRGYVYASRWNRKYETDNSSVNNSGNNPLRTFFDANKEGNGIWKFIHYFDIYQRHFSKYVGKEVHIVEVGIYSGGSLKMWKNYFGDKCKIYGIDIQKECMSYEDESIKIFIGDQENRNFWKEFKEKVPRVDILIDDGGHLVEQQIATLEEMLPHLSPGGVYLCEDVAGNRNRLTAYINGMQNYLNTINHLTGPVQRSTNTGFQQQVCSIHQYPYVFIVEKQDVLVNELTAPKHGTLWAPFFKAVEK